MLGSPQPRQEPSVLKTVLRKHELGKTVETGEIFRRLFSATYEAAKSAADFILGEWLF
jgi:hypothetical protein